jgi:hypothetical protein
MGKTTMIKTMTIQDVLNDRYSCRFDAFLIACVESLTLPYTRNEYKSDACRLVESVFSDNTIRDIVGYAINQEVDTVNGMICVECGSFSEGREKCSCEETQVLAMEQLRAAACSL